MPPCASTRPISTAAYYWPNCSCLQAISSELTPFSTPLLKSILRSCSASLNFASSYAPRSREGDMPAAARHAAEAEELRPRVAGRAGDTSFDDFRDADDLHAGFFEILT